MQQIKEDMSNFQRECGVFLGAKSPQCKL